MRRDLPRAAALPLIPALIGLLPAWAASEGPPSETAAAEAGHGARAAVILDDDLTPEQRERVARLFGRILCACPRENWTRTLAGCGEGCADPQRGMVRAAVKAGMSDEAILARQVQIYGTEQVLALPESPAANILPYAIALALAAIVIAVLRRSVRRGRKAAGGGPAAPAAEGRPARDEDRRIADEVERDLEEMDR